MFKQVMVIDDASAIRMVVKQVLMMNNYKVVEASNGKEALEILNTNKDVDLFVCDYNMPEMNGMEFLENLKTNDLYRNYRFTPFIMLTTEASEILKAEGKQKGCRAWLVKPFQPDQLLDAVKKLLV